MKVKKYVKNYVLLERVVCNTIHMESIKIFVHMKAKKNDIQSNERNHGDGSSVVGVAAYSYPKKTMELSPW
ncbi:MAG: hypothetical protein ACOYVK_13055 [Bacillota bacterium]